MSAADAFPAPAAELFSWSDFKARVLSPIFRLNRDRRTGLLFRGQSDSSWPLKSTLDRARSFAGDRERLDFVGSLLAEFRRESLMIQHGSEFLSGDALELLARHHGLESQLLDWTESPFIASYFALLDVAKGGTARVWILNRFALPSGALSSSIELIDDPELLRFNRRALQQKSVFMRVNSAQESLEKAMRPALYACDLPGADRGPALSEFDAMNINGTSLFGDLDGVARTVRARMFFRD